MPDHVRCDNSTATYDLLGRALTRTDATGRATGYQYLVDATTDRVTQPGGATTAITLTAFGEAGVVTDPLGHVTSYAYDRVGRAITVTDPRGTPTAAAYDALGRVTAVTEAVGHPEQRSSGYGYDAAGDLDSVTDPRGTVTKLARDSAGRVTGVTTAWGTSVALTTGYEYDARDQMTAVVRPGGRRSESAYDLLGQQVSVTEGVGTALVRTTTLGYDAGGNRTTVTDPLNHVTTTAYDKSARPVSITNAVGAVTAVTYDAAGRVQQVTDPVGNVTAYGYDDAGRTLTVTDPRGKVTATAYDAAGRVRQVTDRLGQRRVLTRDANGQVTSEDWYTTVNAKVETRSYGYDADDNLTSATNSAGGYTLGYDRLNRVTSAAGPAGVNLAMGYDAGGNRTLVTDNKGAGQSSGYDAQGRLSSRVLNDGATQVQAVWNYDAATGDLASLARSESVAGSGAWVSAGSSAWGRDALGRVTSLATTSGSGATLASYAYGYDAADRMASEVVNGVATNYGYDAANQLTQAGNQSFSYDLAGNRAGPGMVIGAGNRVLSDAGYTYAYDDDGQLTGKSAVSGGASWSYGYDVAGRMTTASQADGGSVAYTFDALGNRVGRSESIGAATSVERYVIDAWDTAKSGSVGTESSDTWADLDGSGAVTSRRLFGPGFDDPVARVDGGSSAASWYGSDGRGSVTSVFTTAGTVTGSRSYAAFGAVTAESGAGLDRYGYTAREWDAVAGLQYSRARMYDPTGGVFTGEDPMGFGAGDSNLRRYVGNGPTNASDPSGLFIITKPGSVVPGWVKDIFAKFDVKYSLKIVDNSHGPFWGDQTRIGIIPDDVQQVIDLLVREDGRRDEKQPRAMSDQEYELLTALVSDIHDRQVWREAYSAPKFSWNERATIAGEILANSANREAFARRLSKRFEEEDLRASGPQMNAMLRPPSKASREYDEYRLEISENRYYLEGLQRYRAKVRQVASGAKLGDLRYNDRWHYATKFCEPGGGFDSLIAVFAFAPRNTRFGAQDTTAAMREIHAGRIYWWEQYAKSVNNGNVRPIGPVAPAAPPRTAGYSTLTKELEGTGQQAHHLNQNAAFRDIIPESEGLSVGLRGNAFTEVGSPHYQAHRSLEGFWNQFRRGGARFGQTPTNAEYGAALEASLRAGGLSSTEAASVAAQAAQQRAAYGLAPNAPVPRIPGRINQTPPPPP